MERQVLGESVAIILVFLAALSILLALGVTLVPSSSPKPSNWLFACQSGLTLDGIN